jgi:hypothetical protein
MSQKFAKVKALAPIGNLRPGDTGPMDSEDAKDAAARGDVEIIQNNLDAAPPKVKKGAENSKP